MVEKFGGKDAKRAILINKWSFERGLIYFGILWLLPQVVPPFSR
jgi:hypothetical protein